MTNADVPELINELITRVSDNKWVILFIINIILLIVGTFMDITPAILIFTPIFLPIAQHLGIDPINAGLHIYSAFQNLIARECDPSEKVSLTFGAFQAGSTTNIVPDQAILMGTLRTYNKQLRKQLVKRMQEICEYTGKAFHVSVDYVTVSDVPSTYSDPELTTDLAEYASDIIPDFICDTNYKVTPSDDFAFISEQVPTAYFMIGCQVEGCSVQHHNPGVLFDEAVLPYGAATHAACAFHWLNKEN